MSADVMTVQPLQLNLQPAAVVGVFPPAATPVDGNAPPAVPNLTPIENQPTSPDLDEAVAISELSSMFPEIDEETLGMILAHHGGDAERAAASLLEDVSPVEADDAFDMDALIAQLEQNQLDEENARELQEALTNAQAELERMRNRGGDPSAPSNLTPRTRRLVAAAGLAGTATVAGTAAAAVGTKKLIALVRMAKMRRGATVPTTERLLDGATDSSTPADEPKEEPSLGSLSFSYTPPTPVDEEHSTPCAAKYSSRVDRARAANRARGFSSPRSTPSSSTSSDATPLLGALPVEQLHDAEEPIRII